MNMLTARHRPILFSDRMNLAIRNDAKTVTRRVVKLHPPYVVMGEKNNGDPWPWFENPNDGESGFVPCPYGVPGDRLWVREAFRFGISDNPEDHGQVMFEVEDEGANLHPDSPADSRMWCRKWSKRKPGMFLPRWAARTYLEVLAVRVERLQAMDGNEAILEGMDYPVPHGCENPACTHPHELEVFKTGWDLMHGKGAGLAGPFTWAANPWVWRIEFRRLP